MLGHRISRFGSAIVKQLAKGMICFQIDSLEAFAIYGF